MDLLDRIETQLISNRLPLVAVTVAAVPYANTPVVLTLHWHGFIETRLADVTDANVIRVPIGALLGAQLNERWDSWESSRTSCSTSAGSWARGASRASRRRPSCAPEPPSRNRSSA